MRSSLPAPGCRPNWGCNEAMSQNWESTSEICVTPCNPLTTRLLIKMNLGECHRKQNHTLPRSALISQGLPLTLTETSNPISVWVFPVSGHCDTVNDAPDRSRLCDSLRDTVTTILRLRERLTKSLPSVINLPDSAENNERKLTLGPQAGNPKTQR